MNRLVPVLLGLLFGFVFLSAPSTHLSAVESNKLLIVYTGNLLAELKPCGCAKEEDQGGIERRMQYLKDLRKKKPNLLLVDTGDHFKEPTRQGKLKAETLAVLRPSLIKSKGAGLPNSRILSRYHPIDFGASFVAS